MRHVTRTLSGIPLLILLALTFILISPQQAYAGATLTVNTTSGDFDAEDDFLSLHEAVRLASGDLRRPLTAGERNQITGGCFVPFGPFHFIVSPPNPANNCPNIGPGFSDNIVFSPNVDEIFTGIGLHLGCNDHINGDRGNGMKVILNGPGEGNEPGILIQVGECNKGLPGMEGLPGNTQRPANQIRNLFIRRFGGPGILASSPEGAVFEGLVISRNGSSGIVLISYDMGGRILNPSNNRIGGPNLNQRNFIFSNDGDGIQIIGDSRGTGINNQMMNNFIGLTSETASAPSGNAGNGIALRNVSENTIGGIHAGEGNVIVSNKENGILVSGVNARKNSIFNNSIGVNGDALFGNSQSGVQICCGAQETSIDSNTIGNNDIGITLKDETTGKNAITHNFIGTNSAGNKDMGNLRAGIAITDKSSGNRIGALRNKEISNVIAFNKGEGVLVISGVANLIAANRIEQNANLGIDLAPGGITENDVGDVDSGANNLQNNPVITSAELTGPSIRITGSLNATRGTTHLILFYQNRECDPSASGEGQQFLGEKEVATDDGGNLSFDMTFETARDWRFITATATNMSTGDTSEFSRCFMAGGTGQAGRGNTTYPFPTPGNPRKELPVGTLSSADLSVSIAAIPGIGLGGVSMTYQITVTNNGPSAAQALTVTDNLPGSLAFVSCNSSGTCAGSGNNRVITFQSLAANSSTTITLMAVPAGQVTPGMEVRNSATVNSITPDPNTSNNSATSTFTVPRLGFP